MRPKPAQSNSVDANPRAELRLTGLVGTPSSRFEDACGLGRDGPRRVETEIARGAKFLPAGNVLENRIRELSDATWVVPRSRFIELYEQLIPLGFTGCRTSS